MRNFFALLALGLVASGAWAAESVKVTEAWVRAPAPGQKTAGAYMEITSAGNAALLAAASSAAARAELHSTSIESGIMRMRALERVELPAGKTVSLAPGGVHVMLVDLKRALKPGDKVPIVLSVQPAGSGTAPAMIKLEAEVRGAAASSHRH